MSEHAEARLLKVAGRQHLVFSAAQASEAGIAPSTLQRNVANGRFVRLHRGIYVPAGVPIGWQQRAAGAWLACGPRSVLSFGTATVIWSFAHDLDAADVTVPRTHGRAHARIRIHESERLDAVRYLGFRVTSPMRTLLDLASFEREDTVALFLDDAVRRRLIDLGRFAGYLAQPFTSRRPGTRVLRAMVAARDPTSTIDSAAETLLFEALRAAGVPAPVPQLWVTTRRRRARVDFAYPDARVAIEVDGWKDHGTRDAFESDRARQNELAELGWRVVRFTWLQLTNEPTDVAITVARALGLRPSRWRGPRGRKSPRVSGAERLRG